MRADVAALRPGVTVASDLLIRTGSAAVHRRNRAFRRLVRRPGDRDRRGPRGGGRLARMGAHRRRRAGGCPHGWRFPSAARRWSPASASLGSASSSPAVPRSGWPWRRPYSGRRSASCTLPSWGSACCRLSADLGVTALFFVFAIVWATDTGAFFAGRTIGGPSSGRAVSPKKTWAARSAALVAARRGRPVVGAGAGPAAAAAACVATALSLSVACQLGDLFESAVKRRFSVKDSRAYHSWTWRLMDRVDGCFAVRSGALSAGPGAVPTTWPKDCSYGERRG